MRACAHAYVDGDGWTNEARISWTRHAKSGTRWNGTVWNRKSCLELPPRLQFLRHFNDAPTIISRETLLRVSLPPLSSSAKQADRDHLPSKVTQREDAICQPCGARLGEVGRSGLVHVASFVLDRLSKCIGRGKATRIESGMASCPTARRYDFIQRSEAWSGLIVSKKRERSVKKRGTRDVTYSITRRGRPQVTPAKFYLFLPLPPLCLYFTQLFSTLCLQN